MLLRERSDLAERSKTSWNGQNLAISTASVFDTGGGDVATVTIKSTQILSVDATGLSASSQH
jgi:hypothetical protein